MTLCGGFYQMNGAKMGGSELIGTLSLTEG